MVEMERLLWTYIAFFHYLRGVHFFPPLFPFRTNGKDILLLLLCAFLPYVFVGHSFLLSGGLLAFLSGSLWGRGGTQRGVFVILYSNHCNRKKEESAANACPLP
jgi:hypothetical protein